ncbi:MAG: methylenetetrahydrofolate reductase [NAD(P)H] [Gammaproteobacteria bacterium]|nr:methylenetetrahydrofolate reductase [NAD(P)H] [Gammaproteobacteria bacterium]
MKIIQSHLSFEFFPPKTIEGTQNLQLAALELSHYRPHFFSVTYGAGGSTRMGTLDAIDMLKRETLIPVAPHLTCIGTQAETVDELLIHYKQRGIKRIVALRGDLPDAGLGDSDFRYASDLVHYIRQRTGDHFYIEVAAYPEIHPQAGNAAEDVLNLKRKQDAGANSAITQYFYNADAYFYFLDECTKQGVTLPIIPGIMPIVNYERLAQFSAACGAEIPRYLCKWLESYSEKTLGTHGFASEVVYHLCQKLLRGGAPGLHFYTLNKAEATCEVLAMLGYKPRLQPMPRIAGLASEII